MADDIGLEVVPECVKVIKVAPDRTGLAIEWHPLPIGKAGHEEHGNTLPAVTEEGLRAMHGWVMGPIGHNAYPRGDATWVMPPVRKKFDLFAALRPALSYASIRSVHKDVDIAFVRELTEGMLYSETVIAGLPEFRPNDDITVAMRVITRKGSNRVAREAFELARTRKKRKVTAAHMEPVYRLACGIFAEECRKVAKDYPDVNFEEMMIGSIAMKLVLEPQRIDVVVTTNQFGDILTDIGAGLVGGLGLAPRPLRGRKAGDGTGHARLGSRYCRTERRESLCHDHVRTDAVGLAPSQAQRAEGKESRGADPKRSYTSARRGQDADARPRWHGYHRRLGRCHRCKRLTTGRPLADVPRGAAVDPIGTSRDEIRRKAPKIERRYRELV